MEISVGIDKHNSTGAARKGTKQALFLNDSASQADQRSGDPRFETMVACTIGFCLIKQSSAGPIAIPRPTRIGSVDAHNMNRNIFYIIGVIVVIVIVLKLLGLF